ncbi:MAG TPA: DUF1841 family protein [Anaerolineaceae bacterium]
MEAYPQPELNTLFKQYTRQRIWEIWQAGKNAEPLNAEDSRLYEVMERHLQYGKIWDRLDEATDDDVLQGGVNVVLHVLFHQMVENQIAEDDPPAVRQVMRVLLQKGLKEHEAAHAIASVIAFEIFDMMKNNRMFDVQRYIRELRKLPLQVKAAPHRNQ